MVVHTGSLWQIKWKTTLPISYDPGKKVVKVHTLTSVFCAKFTNCNLKPIFTVCCSWHLGIQNPEYKKWDKEKERERGGGKERGRGNVQERRTSWAVVVPGVVRRRRQRADPADPEVWNGVPERAHLWQDQGGAEELLCQSHNWWGITKIHLQLEHPLLCC